MAQAVLGGLDVGAVSYEQCRLRMAQLMEIEPLVGVAADALAPLPVDDRPEAFPLAFFIVMVKLGGSGRWPVV